MHAKFQVAGFQEKRYVIVLSISSVYLPVQVTCVGFFASEDSEIQARVEDFIPILSIKISH